MLRTLYVINKSGGLILHRDLAPMPQLRGNETLRLGSTFHSLHAIASQISPVPGAEGIETVEADTFVLHCFQSLTGTKFFVIADPGVHGLQSVLGKIYELYADYVLKNPFYEMDMPIRCELFDKELHQLVQRFNGSSERKR